MKFTSIKKSLTETNTDLLVITIFEGDKTFPEEITLLDEKLDKLISSYVLEKEKFKGKLNEIYVLPTYGKISADKILVAGLGKKEEFTSNKLREVSSKIVKRAKALKVKNISFVLPENTEAAAQTSVEGLILGGYEFDKYKSKKEDDDKVQIENIEFIGKNVDVQKGLDKGEIIANAQNFARTLVNEPASVATPTKLAEEACKIKGIECTIFEKDEIENMEMGAFLAVGLGSSEPPKFIHMIYKPNGQAKKKIAIVGKGITFDSGGLDLKPPASMRDMKGDMSGSAITLGIMRALTALKPDVEVHGIIATCENMPGCSAYKPGDILTAKNKKTIEVDNTDAEGRLTLADALCYITEQNMDEVIDIATLTGACVVALGETISGIMGNNQELIDKLISSADKSGEKFWQLPVFDEHKEDIKSPVADMKNAGSRYAGASTAAAFLKEFVGKTPWAHIDIAGPAILGKEFKELSKGPSAAGLRAIINYILSI